MAVPFDITSGSHASVSSESATHMSAKDVSTPAVMSVEANFLPSHEGDSMFDAIVTYLKTKDYPSFIKSTTDAVAARSEFRRKCSTFFLDKSDELLQGRAAGVHRHVLRRGELRTVFRFVHEALGHCSADVW
ncbi:unnamed protein product [Haemonchus placei]|uniref:SnoaL-like domain-containing protein n=1 Tax=Haemonchus placei TaxID=6290 RepID=A0A0N4W448_HAEPC|nr:unnamed protein product [Haemonchus placei]